jgi:hypothetical protein
MFRRNHPARTCLAAAAAIGLIAATAHAAYVTPKIGGGQTGGGTAPMKHADVYYNGTTHTLTVVLDETVPTPVLRPITPPDEWDPNQPYSVLSYQAYNYQWAWNPAPGGIDPLPGGSAIWVERVYQDPAFTVYLRPPMYVYSEAQPKWPEIFTADGYRWKWSGAMQHNAYAVCGPYQTEYSATYTVYIGDAITGEPLAGEIGDTVTWIWNATLVGDMNGDGVLDGADVHPFTLALMDRTAYETAYPTCRYFDADCNCDGLVDMADVQSFITNALEL